MEGIRIIPVVDILGRQAVHAIGGDRRHYSPLKSRLTTSVVPLEVGQALLQATGARELYVADLDQILKQSSESSADRIDWLELNCNIILDNGLTDAAEIDFSQPYDWVLASETLREIPGLWPRQAIASLDLQAGKLLSPIARMTQEAWLATAVAAGCLRVIVLDLAAVGRNAGPQTLEMCRWLRQTYPRLEIISGGGIRDWDDVQRFQQAGADAVLVASALHDGRLLN